MDRRNFLKKSACHAAGLAAVTQLADTLFAKKRRIDRSRISAISDEVALSPEDAIAFAHQYRLRWLELREVPGMRGKPYYYLPEAELKVAAKQFRDADIRISFLNTNLLKNVLPGTVPVRRKEETAEVRKLREEQQQREFDQRFENLRKCSAAAHAFDTKYVRVFTFKRVQEPETVYERVANIIGELGHLAGKEGIMLLVENEASCNVGNSWEITRFLKLIPEKAVGFNWDARNAMALNENPFPDGYELLPKKRMRNAQIKGHDMLDPETPIDWMPIFAAMDRDGFEGCIGLETHYFDGTKIEKSHLAMEKILRIADANATYSNS